MFEIHHIYTVLTRKRACLVGLHLGLIYFFFSTVKFSKSIFFLFFSHSASLFFRLHVLTQGALGKGKYKSDEEVAPFSKGGNGGRSTQPPTAIGKSGSLFGIHTHCMRVFCTLSADLYAQSVLIDEISVSELSRKFIKSALLVGKAEMTKNSVLELTRKFIKSALLVG